MHAEQAARLKRGREADRLQEIEGNPLTAEEKAMFDMFEREGWTFEERRRHILSLRSGTATAAE